MPTRTCVGCRCRERQDELIRFRVTCDGELTQQIRLGRSAYVHPHRACVQALPGAKSLMRSLRQAVPVDARERFARALLSRLDAGEDGIVAAQTGR